MILCALWQEMQFAVVVRIARVLVLGLYELPRMGRGKGVRLQKYKDGVNCLTQSPSQCREGLKLEESGSRTRNRARPY